MHTAVIITTYNRPDALTAVLAGYAAQRDAGFELVIADDGSTDGTRHAIDAFKACVKFSVSHVWHEDRGFCAAAIRFLVVRLRPLGMNGRRRCIPGLATMR